MKFGLPEHLGRLESALASAVDTRDGLLSWDWCAVLPGRPRGGELRTQKLKFHLVRTQSLNVLPIKPGVGQYIAIHATLTAKDFFLANFYPWSILHFFQNLSWVLSVLAAANTGSCVGPQNKISHPAGCRFPCWVPMEYIQATKTWLVVKWFVNWKEELGDTVKFVFSGPAVGSYGCRNKSPICWEHRAWMFFL